MQVTTLRIRPSSIVRPGAVQQRGLAGMNVERSGSAAARNAVRCNRLLGQLYLYFVCLRGRRHRPRRSAAPEHRPEHAPEDER